MNSVHEWKALLRAELRTAFGATDKRALTVRREMLAAIENVEAPPMTLPATTDGPFAGSSGGLGAGEVERLSLTPRAVLAIIERALAERREAAAEYRWVGRHEEEVALRTQADVLAAIAAEAG